MDKLAYQIYVTDALRGLAGGECARYADWIDGKTAQQDTRTGDDIDRELSEKFGWAEVKRDESA